KYFRFLPNGVITYNIKGKYQVFDPCNNPADAMPIIIENLISLMADMSEDGGLTWWCASDISNGITSRYKSNPLRAAMEVFLLMKEAENEKV
uniref:phage protein NinX family protein n=1 Tax=Proteus sp. TJ1640 TaxID=2050968 RepID=UPI000D690839